LLDFPLLSRGRAALTSASAVEGRLERLSNGGAGARVGREDVSGSVTRTLACPVAVSMAVGGK